MDKSHNNLVRDSPLLFHERIAKFSACAGQVNECS